MASAIRVRRLSPFELVDAHVRQIERENPRLNAFARVFGEEARAQAGNQESLPDGPLRGVPVTVKDSFDMAGLPTLCGSRLRLGHRATRDAAAVARLRAAGAIIIGKTNCPEMLWNYETDNFVTGRTNNPFDVTRTAGGSSGGEGAAIGSYCSAGGIGSDGGGSIRIPAAFCGIAGLKPTPGRISGAGHYPEVGYPGGLLGVAGPMARTARDVRLLYQVLAGNDYEDPFAAPVPVAATPPDVAGLRVGIWERFGDIPVAPEVRDALQRAAAALPDAGFGSEPFNPRGLEQAPKLWWFFFGQLPAPLVRDLLGDRASEAHWTVTDFLNRGLDRGEISGREVVERLARRDAMRRSFLRQMEQTPVLLAPPCGTIAFAHRQRAYPTPSRDIDLWEAMAPATVANLLGLPAMVIGAGRTSTGLPVGVQLIARPWQEDVLLEAAVRLEAAMGCAACS
jgi:amidase